MSLVIIGSAGHAGVVIDAIRQQGRGTEIVGLLDDFLPKGTERHGLKVLGRVEDIATLDSDYRYFIAVGDNSGRSHVWDRIQDTRKKAIRTMASVGHPASVILGHTEPGVFVAALGCVGVGASVGKGSIINSSASLGHDSKLGEFSHLGPGAVTGGHVSIGNHTMIGIGAMIRDHIRIGNNCVIGMGAVVLKDVPDYTEGFGNPFKPRYIPHQEA